MEGTAEELLKELFQKVNQAYEPTLLELGCLAVYIILNERL